MVKRTLVFFFLLAVCFEAATAAGRLELISPERGDRFQAGERILIRWIKGKSGRWVRLEALKDGKPIIIKKKTRNRGSFRWVIPKDLPSGGYTIKVTSLEYRSSAKSGMVIIDNPKETDESGLSVLASSCKSVPPIVYADERSLQLSRGDGYAKPLHVGLWAGAVALHDKAIIDFGFDFDLDGTIEPVIGEANNFKRTPKFTFHKEQVPLNVGNDSQGVPPYGCVQWLHEGLGSDKVFLYVFRMNVIATDSDHCSTIEPIEVYVSFELCAGSTGDAWSYPEILSNEPNFFEPLF